MNSNARAAEAKAQRKKSITFQLHLDARGFHSGGQLWQGDGALYGAMWG